MKKIVTTLAVLAILATVCVLTCPDSPKHKKALMIGFKTALNDKIKESSGLENLGYSLLGSALGAEIIGAALENRLDVENHFVYSTGIIDNYVEKHTVTFGILGHVFVLNGNLSEAVGQLSLEF